MKDQKYKKYKYRLLELYDELSYRDRQVFKNLLKDESGFNGGTFRNYMYLVKQDSKVIPGDLLVICADLLSKMLKRSVSPEDLFNEPLKKISSDSLKVLEVVIN